MGASQYKTKVGAGLPAMAVYLPPEMLAGLALSRASPLPQGILAGHKICAAPQNKGGSWLAGDGGVSAAGNVGWAGAIAGKPAPTGDFGWAQDLRRAT